MSKIFNCDKTLKLIQRHVIQLKYINFKTVLKIRMFSLK